MLAPPATLPKASYGYRTGCIHRIHRACTCCAATLQILPSPSAVPGGCRPCAQLVAASASGRLRAGPLPSACHRGLGSVLPLSSPRTGVTLQGSWQARYAQPSQAAHGARAAPPGAPRRTPAAAPPPQRPGAAKGASAGNSLRGAAASSPAPGTPRRSSCTRGAAAAQVTRWTWAGQACLLRARYTSI
jgi:hypothetical protein